MERCLMGYYVLNDTLTKTCECNPNLFDEAPSIYEVIRVERGIPLFLDEHIQRFFRSARLWGKHLPVSGQQIRTRVKTVIESNGLKTGLIKFIFLNHPQAGAVFAAWVTPFYFPSEDTYKKGVKLVTHKGIRVNPNAKVSHQQIRAEADEIIREQKVYEVVLVNRKNIITEGSRSNLFFVMGGLLFTAHHGLVLEGITRTKITNLALDSGIDVVESEFYLNELPDFEAAFITGTTPKVLPIKQINQVGYNVEHPVVRHLMKRYEELIG